MGKILFLFIFTSLFLNAESVKKESPGLFASVVNVAQNDVLNVREEPNSKSNKVGSYIPDSGMQIDYCVEIKSSKWCKVYPEVNVNYGGRDHEAGSGWVNAYYLKFHNIGYVNIINKKSNCDYVLRCEKEKCLILGYEKEEWIPRKFLGVETGLKETSKEPEKGGEDDDASGLFCFNHRVYTLQPYLERREKN